MQLGEVGALLNKTLGELASMPVDEFDFWVAFIAAKHGNNES